MKNQSKEIPPLYKVASAAVHDAFLKAAERAKQTRTYLVIERNNKIEHIPLTKSMILSRIMRMKFRIEVSSLWTSV